VEEEQQAVSWKTPRRTAYLFLAVTILGILLTVAYTTARIVSEPVVDEVFAAPAVAATPPETRSADAAPPPGPAKTAALPRAAVPLDAPLFRKPANGEIYLQTRATSRPDAEDYVRFLRLRGFPACYTVGLSESLYRVLVGPARDGAHLDELRSRMNQDGLEWFQRKYPVNDEYEPFTTGGGLAP